MWALLEACRVLVRVGTSVSCAYHHLPDIVERESEAYVSMQESLVVIQACNGGTEL